jgi:hypothetical protein
MGLLANCQNIIYSPPIVPYAIGDTLDTGTSYIANQIQNHSTFVHSKPKTNLKTTFNPSDKYFVVSWADYFLEDYRIIIPLLNKYGYTATFYIPVKPSDNNFKKNAIWSKKEFDLISNSGSYRGAHGFLHYILPFDLPKADGFYFPSNDNFRIDRGDGNNEYGFDITSTVLNSYGYALAYDWLMLPSETYNKTWTSLSDADCQLIRDGMSAFKITEDPQNNLNYLQTLDSLSNYYCGTTGYSIKDNYITRTPNTVDGNYPSITNRILGGIFQGASSLQNQEIWERILYIEKRYIEEFEHIKNNLIFWSSSGGTGSVFHFKPTGIETYKRYFDVTHDTLADGTAQLISSITGETRSLHDLLRRYGYKVTMANFAQGYNSGSYYSDRRHESQRIYKKNAFNSKPDNIGDGFEYSFRYFDPYMSRDVFSSIISNDSIVKELYNYTDTASRYDVYYSNNFSEVLKHLMRFIAWGTIPDGIGDSGLTNDSTRASFALTFEALLNFCKQSGINVISHEQAMNICYNDSIEHGVNLFPNPNFVNTLEDIIPSANNVPAYPDGWDGGLATEDTIFGETKPILHINNISGSSVTYFTRSYIVQFGTMTFSCNAIGEGTIKVRKIINQDVYNNISGNLFSEIMSFSVNNNNSWQSEIDNEQIIDVPLITYSTPINASELSQQNYYQGFDNKICGFQIEITVAAGKSLKIANPSIIIQ